MSTNKKGGPGWEWPDSPGRSPTIESMMSHASKDRRWVWNEETGKYDIPPAHPDEKPLDPNMLWEGSW